MLESLVLILIFVCGGWFLHQPFSSFRHSNDSLSYLCLLNWVPLILFFSHFSMAIFKRPFCALLHLRFEIKLYCCDHFYFGCLKLHQSLLIEFRPFWCLLLSWNNLSSYSFTKFFVLLSWVLNQGHELLAIAVFLYSMHFSQTILILILGLYRLYHNPSAKLSSFL